MGRCRRHPHHFVVGVCAHCLNDRLLALMEEEDDDELMKHELSGFSPHAYNTYMPPLASSSAHASSTFCKNGGVAITTPAGYKYHPSFSASPQLHPSHATRPPLQGPARAPSPFLAEKTSRKKRPSLWSFLVRPKDDAFTSKRQYVNAYDGEFVHLRRDELTSTVKAHRISGAHCAEEEMKQRSEHGWRADGNVSDSFPRCGGRKPSLSSSRREALESLSKPDASSLLASPNFMASPSRKACSHGLYPSPISKYTPTSPLNNESSRYRDSPRASPARQVPVSYGLSGHVESFGLSEYDQDDDDSSRQSWISSFFSRRHGRAKSISGGDAMSFSHPLHSVGASPEVGSRGRRKSVSFLDDHSQGSPSRFVAAKLSQSSGTGIGHEALNVQCPHTYIRDTKNRAFREHLVGQNYSGSHGNELLAAGLSASPTIPRTDSTSSKSPRAKLANFLSRRKNGTMSIDCGRDVRVSPVPMLRVKKDYCNHQDVLNNSDHDNPAGSQCLDGCRRPLEHCNDRVSNRFAEHLVMDSRFKEELQKNSMAVDRKADILKSPTDMAASSKDTSKSPRLMSLQAMKQLLRSPRLAPVRTTKRESEDEVEGQAYSQSTRSWSKAFSKTLSPMLGRKPKKKPSFRKQEFAHYAYTHSSCGLSERPQQVKEGRGSQRQGKLNGQYGIYHYGNHPSGQKLHLQHQHGKRSSMGGRDELLVHETRVLPVCADEKGPPQQYSFLSKDYSAFSFYFSPRRSGSIDSATRSTKKSSVW